MIAQAAKAASAVRKEVISAVKAEKRTGTNKVDNAIIMAAGESRRCLPLSELLPKGLFVVKGEVLIEREF